MMFILTSSSSLLASGLLLGMGCWYAVKMIEFVGAYEKMETWFWMLGHKYELKVYKGVVFSYLAAFALISWWIWR